MADIALVATTGDAGKLVEFTATDADEPPVRL